MLRNRQLTAQLSVFVAAIATVVIAVAKVVQPDAAAAVWTPVSTARARTTFYITSHQLASF